MKDIYQNHPKWDELDELCRKIERLKSRASNLREEIDKDLFGDKLKEKEK